MPTRSRGNVCRGLRAGGARSRAFTIVDLLATLAAACLIGVMILPTLNSSRHSSMGTQSANLIRRHAQRQELYAAANQDVWVNPFDPTLNSPAGDAWVWDPGQVGNLGWPYTTESSERFGYNWLSHLLYSQGQDQADWRVLAAPGDGALIAFIRGALPAPHESIFPTSYWYGPVFWQASTRFVTVSPPNAFAGNRWLLRRNTVADVASPSRKALLFESRDFESARARQWNVVGSKPYLALCDGSVKKTGTAVIEGVTNPPTAPAPGPGRLWFPSGLWNGAGGEESGLPWTSGRPAHYWRTRHGVQGADIL